MNRGAVYISLSLALGLHSSLNWMLLITLQALYAHPNIIQRTSYSNRNALRIALPMLKIYESKMHFRWRVSRERQSCSWLARNGIWMGGGSSRGISVALAAFTFSRGQCFSNSVTNAKSDD